MQNQEMPMEKEAPAEAPAPEQGGGEDPLKAIAQLQGVLGSMLEAMGSAEGLPPGAIESLSAANDSYNEFVSIITGEGGAPKQGMPQNSPEMVGGGKAVPADQPMGKNIRPA